MSQNFQTAEEVRKSHNALEKLASAFSADDEFLAAMLHNQLILSQMISGIEPTETGQQDVSVEFDPSQFQQQETGVDLNNLPIGYVGTAAEDTEGGNNGLALFSVPERVQVDITPQSSVQTGDTVIVSGPSNKVRAATFNDEALSQGNDTFVWTTGLEPLEVTNSEWDELEFGFNAKTVNVRSTDDIDLSFKEPSGNEDAMISLSKSNSELPFNIGGPVGIDVKKIWYKKPATASTNPKIQVLAYK